MQPIHRRRMLIVAAAALPAVSGCDSESIDETIANASTETLETGAVALRGFAILAYVVGARIVTLPTPGVRILGVALIVTSLTTRLAIEYLDVELNKRHVAEALSDDEKRKLEADLAVTFKLENGETESIPLGPNQYETESQEA